MRYKVFINEKSICFTNEQVKLIDISDGLVLNFFDTQLTIVLIDLLEKDSNINNIYVSVKDVDEAFTAFQSHFKLIKAAGGIVRNKQGKYLMIHRLGKWDLPKGKIEKNEGMEEAAIREVEEECGISGLVLERLIAETFHIYDVKEKVVLKQTYWFTMQTNYTGQLTPQIEENISDVCWMDKEEIKEKVVSNTYCSIKELMETTFL